MRHVRPRVDVMGASERLRLLKKADTLATSTPHRARGGTGGKVKPNRRQFLGASIASASALSFVPGAQAQEAGVMTFALAARSPNSLEPAYVVQGADNWVNMQIFDTLVRPEDGTFAVTPGDFKPSLAESWTTSADGRTWTFQLRKGVKFHGGYG